MSASRFFLLFLLQIFPSFPFRNRFYILQNDAKYALKASAEDENYKKVEQNFLNFIWSRSNQKTKKTSWNLKNWN